MSALTMRVEEHAEVGGPKWFVDGREVELHLGEMFYCVLIGFKSEITHLAQPKVHSLRSPVSIFMEEAAVSFDESTESSFVERNITIIH